jgi:hypothetical protein
MGNEYWNMGNEYGNMGNLWQINMGISEYGKQM